ncbi:hypothetical protein [Liberiplasma polymorphum]|uniref:hypothetical protein n=1 Tax=Liberiplasma polymorphum TaxID=3374570 RepID=UPI0037733761
MEFFPYRSLDKTNSNIEVHKEELELKYLKRKTLFVNIILLGLVAPIMLTLFYSDIGTYTMIVYGLFFIALFGVNFAFYAYEDYFNSLKLAMYITTLSIYMIAVTLIVEIQSPSVFTFLFLAYAVVSVYQDKKAALINNISLFFLGIIIVWRYPNIFRSESTNIQVIYIYIFLAVFVALLSISSFILINRKNFLYNKLAQIKEAEIRMLGLIQDLKVTYLPQSLNANDYYQQVKSFSNELTKKIDIENIFLERLQIIQKLGKTPEHEILKLYPDYDADDIDELKQLKLDLHSKIHYLLFKSSQAINAGSDEKISSDNMFKTLNNLTDSRYTKIITFAVFYTLLKVDKQFLKALDDDMIQYLFKNSEFLYTINPDILNIYQGNSEVFDKIVQDAFNKKVKL